MEKDELKNLKIDPELHRRLKVQAAKTNHSIRELVEAALRVFLAKEEALEKEL